MKETNENERDVVERISAVRRHYPRMPFRLKVELSAAFPSIGLHLAGNGRGAKRGLGPRGEWARPGRIAAAGAMALVLAFLVFSSLVLASGSSLPGSPLYSLKRARERVGLAMTGGFAGKAEKHLALADSRLNELDSLVAAGRVDTAGVEGLARDYNAEVEAVNRMIEENPGSAEARYIAKQLQSLRARKDTMVDRLSAQSPVGALAVAEDASVEVIDTGGSGVLGATGRVNGTTDDKGMMQFVVDSRDTSNLAALDAVIRKDGRKAVLPVFSAARGNDSYNLRVEPEIPAVRLNEPVAFTLSVRRKDGSAAGHRKLKLSDSSRTSLINGRFDEAVTWSDAGGSCSFNMVKTSASEVSRVTLRVDENGWVDAGLVMALGALEAPGSTEASGGVTSRVSGSASNPQGVELDNGVVRVTSRKTGNGEVMRSLTRTGYTTAAGPLYDTLAAETRAVGGRVSVDGPRQVISNGESAAYEIAFTAAVSGGSIKKAYRVSLAPGETYATIECAVTLGGAAVEAARKNPGVLTPCVMAKPAGATVEVNGGRYESTEGSTLYSFQVGHPFVAFGANGNVVVAACASDSTCYPDAWVVTDESIAATIGGGGRLSAGGFETTMIIGVTGKSSIESIVSRAREGVGDRAVAAGSTSMKQSEDGFTVLTVPGLGQLGKGRQKITLEVLKQYELVFDRANGNR